MLQDLRLDVAPEVQPITVAEAKAHLHLEADDTEQDSLIQGYIDTAVDWLDGYAGVLGRAMISQSWILSLEGFPGQEVLRRPVASRAHHHHRRIRLPLPPLITVDQIDYIDPAGAAQVLAADQYVVLEGPLAGIDPAPNCSWPATRRQARAVSISFTAGYGAAADNVPGPLRNAIRLLVGHFFANREAVVGVENRDSSAPLPIGVAELIRPFRARQGA